MQNTKFLKIIIAIIVILILVFLVLVIGKNKGAEDLKDIPSNTDEVTNRPVFQTNTSSNSTSTNDYIPNDTSDYMNETGRGPEDVLNKKISKILFDWTITRDENSLREALALSENADNEAILEAWVPFMQKDSAELLKLINTSSDGKRTKAGISVLFQWYINLSGDYEKLSTAKRQQITNQYNQLK